MAATHTSNYNSSRNIFKNIIKVSGTALGIFLASACASTHAAGITAYNTSNADDAIEASTTTALSELFLLGNDWNNASFKGDIKELSKVINENLKYPEAAYKNNIEGCVNVEFSIAPDGGIDNIKVDNTVNPILAQEVIRCVKLTAGLWGITNKSEHPTYKLSFDFEL